MRNLLLPLCAFLTMMILWNPNAQATHVMGADITYTCDSAYVFTFKVTFYRDCRGVPFSNPSSSTNIRNVASGKSASVTLKLESITDITPVCSKVSKPCNPSNTISSEGIEAHVYSATIDFKKTPYSAVWDTSNCQVILETGQCCRNGAITTGPTGNFYTYAMLDLCKGFNNSSPEYKGLPVAQVCCFQPVYMTMGGYDYVDGDSLVYKLANPLYGFNKNASYSGSYSYKNPIKVYDPTGKGIVNQNAIPPIGLYIDSETGQMIFTPDKCDEVTVAVMEIEEWRKDKSGKYSMIGLTRRDIQIVVKNCPDNNPPTLKSAFSFKAKASLCEDQSLCFNITTDDKIYAPPPPLPKPPQDTVRFYPADLPNGVTMKILNPSAILQTARICVDFTKVDKSKYVNKPLTFEISAHDNACPRNAVTTRTFTIYFDTSSVIGKLAGGITNDQNLNCKTDSLEKPLEHQRKLSIDGDTLLFTLTDKQGNFTLCLDTGTRTISLIPDPWFVDSCHSTMVKILKDSIHQTEFYSRLKHGIGGYVFTDSDSCAVNSANRPIEGQMVVANPGNHYATTDANGFYLFQLASGSYKLALVNDTVRWKNRCKDTISITAASGKTVFADTFLNYQKELADLSVSFTLSTGGVVRRGDAPYGVVTVKNLGAFATDSNTIYLQTDSALIDLTQSAAGWQNIGTGLYSYPLNTLQSGSKKQISIKLKSTSTYKTNDLIQFMVYTDSNSYNKELDTANNVWKSNMKVVSSYDPNDKTATPDSIFTVTDRKLTYTVRFQNEGNAEARDVVLRDTISELLDLSTLTFISSSHNYEYVLEGRNLWIKFNDIYLPPKSTNAERSIGSVTFSLELNKNINKETLVKNRVGIYFDIEDVVLTNYQVNHFKSPMEFSDSATLVLCANEMIQIPFLSHFQPESKNSYILEISDSNGNLDNAKVLDSIRSVDTKDTFNFMLPNWLTNSNKYAMRIRSTDPALQNFDEANKLGVGIDILNKPTLIVSATALCYGDSLQLSTDNPSSLNELYVNGNLMMNAANSKFSLKPTANDSTYFIAQMGPLGCQVYSDTQRISVWSVPSISLIADSVYCSGQTEAIFQYDISNSPGKGVSDSLKWELGDGRKSTTPQKGILKHDYATGSYLASVSAGNQFCNDLKAARIHFGHEPTMLIEIDKQIYCSGEQVDLKYRATSPIGSVVKQKWKFGDGDSSFNSDVSHTYHVSQTNTFNVGLEVEDNFGCKGQSSSAITIAELPHCGFDWILGSNPFNVQFSPDSSDYPNYSWNFGDGNSSSDSMPSYTYAGAGKYKVILQVTDVYNCTCIEEKTLQINNVSVDELNSSLVYIYPNPNDGIIYLKGLENRSTSYKVIDPTGKVILEGRTEGDFIDAQILSPGYYYLELHDGDNLLKLRLMISGK